MFICNLMIGIAVTMLVIGGSYVAYCVYDANRAN